MMQRPHVDPRWLLYTVSHALHKVSHSPVHGLFHDVTGPAQVDRHGRPIYFQRVGRLHVHELAHQVCCCSVRNSRSRWWFSVTTSLPRDTYFSRSTADRRGGRSRLVCAPTRGAQRMLESSSRTGQHVDKVMSSAVVATLFSRSRFLRVQCVIILDAEGVGLRHAKTVNSFRITSFIDQVRARRGADAPPRMCRPELLSGATGLHV